MDLPVRSLVLWIPDWPVMAWARQQGTAVPDASPDAAPVAIVDKNVVVSCSATARAEGVRRGQRRRDAQARCPRLAVVAADPDRDQRIFAPLVTGIEELAPGVQIIRPGLCALRARGPARYYGGEAEAAEVLVAAFDAAGFPGARAGVADGPFTAEQAARAPGPAAGSPAADPAVRPPGNPAVRIVPPGEAASFLAPLSVATVGDPELTHLLARLGVHTLGAFAALEPDRVRERFGERGVRLHDLAAGADSRPVRPRTPPPELHREVVFEPPLEDASQVAFGMRIAADEFLARLGGHGLVCTELRVGILTELGERSDRVWLHPGSFDAAAVVDRVRWQLAEAADLRSGVVLVRLEPAAVDAASHHQPAIFGSGADEKVHHVLSRVQAMLGHRGVLTPVIEGGRWLGERQALVPWGDRAEAGPDAARPWPGSLPPPLPTTVFPQALPVDVVTRTGAAIEVSERGVVSGQPELLTVPGRAGPPGRREIVSWAGPWPVDERGWDAERRRVAHRFQVVDDELTAWLLVCEGGVWSAEARYD